MIYETVDSDTPIRQGDIFRHIPRVDLSLSTLAVVDNVGQRSVSWRDLLEEPDSATGVSAVLTLTPVDAIVITQNCDAVRGEYLCLCQVDAFLQATGKAEAPKTAKKWSTLITQHSRTNLRWFYLPADPRVHFDQPMAADFRVIMRVPRSDLDGMRDLRVGRLDKLATEHFRESLAQFFRRYPYDDWYPLTKEQFEAYAESCPEPVKPYPWQQ